MSHPENQCPRLRARISQMNDNMLGLRVRFDVSLMLTNVRLRDWFEPSLIWLVDLRLAGLLKAIQKIAFIQMLC